MDIRKSIIPETQVNEHIYSIFHQIGKFVLVSIQELDENGNPGHQIKTIEIADEYYKELLSDSPEWAIGKPQGHFRLEDIWKLVDKMRHKNGKKDTTKH